MPRYYCDYCDTYLTHDSPVVRKQHNTGYKHKANVRNYYMQFEEAQTQDLIDSKIMEHLARAGAGDPSKLLAGAIPGQPLAGTAGAMGQSMPYAGSQPQYASHAAQTLANIPAPQSMAYRPPAVLPAPAGGMFRPPQTLQPPRSFPPPF